MLVVVRIRFFSNNTADKNAVRKKSGYLDDQRSLEMAWSPEIDWALGLAGFLICCTDVHLPFALKREISYKAT